MDALIGTSGGMRDGGRPDLGMFKYTDMIINEADIISAPRLNEYIQTFLILCQSDVLCIGRWNHFKMQTKAARYDIVQC